MGEDGTSTAATVNDWRAPQQIKNASVGGDDNCVSEAYRRYRLSRFGLPNIQRVLYAICVTRLASRLSKSGQLHKVCGIDAFSSRRYAKELNVNVLLFEHVNGRDYGN